MAAKELSFTVNHMRLRMKKQPVVVAPVHLRRHVLECNLHVTTQLGDVLLEVRETFQTNGCEWQYTQHT